MRSTRFAGVAILIAISLVACGGRDARRSRSYDAAQDAIRRGTLDAAVTRIAEGESGSDPASVWGWKFRLLRAETALLRRDTAQAATLLEPEPPAGPDFAAVAARRHYLRAQSRIQQLKIPDALASLQDARTLATAAGATDILLDVDALQGQALMRMRRWDDAETLLRGVVERSTASRDDYHQAVGLLNLGMGQVVRGRFDQSLVFFERLLALPNLDAYTVYSAALSNAGLSYARLGETDRAIAAQQKAVDSHEKRGLALYLAPALGELGHTYVIDRNPARGLPYLTRAFEVASGAGLWADAALWAGNVAGAALEINDLDRAERFNAEGIRLKQQTGGDTTYNTMNAALIALGRQDLATAERLFTSALERPNIEPAAKWEGQVGLAKVAQAKADVKAAARRFDEALATIQQVRADLLRPEFRMTFLTRVIRFYQAYVAILADAGDQRRALEVADSSRAVVLAERMGGEAQKHATANAAAYVAAAARTHTVWLSYWLAPERSFLWVVSASGVRPVTLPGAAEIERLVEQYRAQIERTTVDPLAASGAGDALYRAVLAPVTADIPAGADVRIVPDGVLHNVNFETLPVDGPRRHYWIEDVTMAVAPSLSLLAANASPSAAAANRSLLLVGDPTPRSKEFPRLGYAPVEMAAVAKHFTAARIVRQSGDGATPAAFFAAGPEKFGVIHFTAHGSANQTRPLESAVILSGEAGSDRLYARDVAERPLAADLVTISACRSAGERTFAGEGLVGFSWAFLRAGARQVVAGLWDVDDQSTAALMDELYAGMARGERGPDALRQAKLALMRRGGHVARPYYWGPFELFTVRP